MTVRVTIDMDQCQGHRMCCLTVPEVLRLGEGKVRYVETVDDLLASAVEVAAVNCPTHAIRVDRSP